MKSRSKITFDRIFGKPLAFLLNLIVWPLGKIFKIDHSDNPEKVKVIVVAKLLGMGSIIRATPMVRALRQKYPTAKYFFITTEKNRQVVKRIFLFDGCLCIRDDSWLHIVSDTIFLVLQLWNYRVDLYFDLEFYSAFSTILATLSLARNRYGFYGESTRFKTGLNTHLVWFNDRQHISRIYLQFAYACGIQASDYSVQKLAVLKQDTDELRQWCEAFRVCIDTPYIVINPNASDLLLERRWPKSYFVLLINALSQSWDSLIFIVGNKQESSYNNALWNELLESAKERTFNLAGQISLGATIALMEKTKLMISNDSGLYHVAVSLKVPVISLWGPGSPDNYGDVNKDNNVSFVCKDIYCSPCIYRTDFPPCKGNNVCMKSISPREIYEKSCEMLTINTISDLSNMDEKYRAESVYTPNNSRRIFSC